MKLSKENQLKLLAVVGAASLAACVAKPEQKPVVTLRPTEPTPSLVAPEVTVVEPTSTESVESVTVTPEEKPTPKPVETEVLHLPEIVMDKLAKITLPEVEAYDVFNFQIYGHLENVAQAPLMASFMPTRLDGNPNVAYDFTPGTGKAMVALDQYGHQWIYGHSGYQDLDGNGVWDPLQFEMFRYLLQGGIHRSVLGGEVSMDETVKRLNSLVGQTVMRSQEVTVAMRIRNVLVVPHTEMDSFGAWTGGALDDAINLDPDFAYFKTHEGEFYVLSLRMPPEDASIYSQSGGHVYSWARAAIALEPAWVK